MKKRIITLVVLAITIVSVSVSAFAASICPSCGQQTLTYYCSGEIANSYLTTCPDYDTYTCTVEVEEDWTLLGCDDCRYVEDPYDDVHYCVDWHSYVGCKDVFYDGFYGNGLYAW